MIEFYLMILLGVVIVSVVLFNLNTKKRHSTKSNKKRDILHTLKKFEQEIANQEKNEFFDKNEAKKIKEYINDTLNNTVDGELSIEKINEEVTNLENTVLNFKKEISRKTDRKKDLIISIRSEVNGFKDYLSDRSFYPKDLIFLANKLQGRALDLETLPVNKLTFTWDELEKELHTFQKELKTFFKLHAQLLSTLEKNKSIDSFQKQELYFYLHNGEFEKTEQLLNQLNSDNQGHEKDLNL